MEKWKLWELQRLLKESRAKHLYVSTYDRMMELLSGAITEDDMKDTIKLAMNKAYFEGADGSTSGAFDKFIDDFISKRFDTTIKCIKCNHVYDKLVVDINVCPKCGTRSDAIWDGMGYR